MPLKPIATGSQEMSGEESSTARFEIERRIQTLLETRHAETERIASNYDTRNDFLDEVFATPLHEGLDREITTLQSLLDEGSLLYQSNVPFEPERRLILTVDFETVNAEFIDYVSRHPQYLETMHWRKFEELLASIFRNQGYRAILGTGSGDQGVDLTLYHKDSIGEIVTLVQAKRYKPTRPITLEPVLSLYGTIERFHANRGLFVTTSRYLPSARALADERSHRLILADSEDIIRWCREVSKVR